ncbi:hypothetical protein MLD38_016000 [Melastoma candidum]|uniref:Uncharacterized protein n=1 Tax=Melastoma candidum TaxID=119954 RepID=A0ACB9RJ55_9MYRT|nr:hypothetical protein MLD38_016000 [Melastoma candidum]
MAASSDFSSLPDDVLSDRILTLLDRPTLGSLSLVSRRLHSLVISSPTPWSIICSLTCPSTLSPLLLPVLPSFPNNPYLSFFLHSYPLRASSFDPSHFASPYLPSRLTSAVDVRHRGEVIFSGVAETDTSTAWFACSPFAIHFMGPGEIFHTPLPELLDANTTDELTLSWILVVPEGRRAANLSSHNVFDT